MKILIVSQNHISSYTGGNEVYTHTLAEELVKRGHEVIYMTNKACAYKTKYRLDIVSGYSIGKFVMPSFKWFRRINQVKPDIVHVSGSGIGITLLGIYCRLINIKSVLTFQAPLKANFLGKLDEFFQTKCFNRIITTSFTNKYYLKKKTKVPIETVLLSLKQKFDTGKSLLGKDKSRNRLNLNKNNKYVLMVAKLDEHHYYKGVEIALKALELLPNKFILILVGDGTLLEKYKVKAEELGIENRIMFLGYVSENILATYYKAADVLILPSTSESEGFGLVILEAMASKTPVVTTSCVGIAPLLAKNQLAKVILPKSSKALASAIRNPIINKKQIELAQEFALSRTPKQMALETERVYEKTHPIS